jgi:hypothetical protein
MRHDAQADHQVGPLLDLLRLSKRPQLRIGFAPLLSGEATGMTVLARASAICLCCGAGAEWWIMDASDEQRARNELLFREVNEHIEEVGEGLDGEPYPVVMFVCECGKTDCMEQIELTRAEYEAVRANPKHFAVLPGHEDLRIARVVERHHGFLVAEKKGEAAKMAIEHDPRA